MTQPTVTVFEIDLSTESTTVTLTARDAIPLGNGTFAVRTGSRAWSRQEVEASRDVRRVLDGAARGIASAKEDAAKCATEHDTHSRAVTIASAATGAVDATLLQVAETLRWRADADRDEIKRLDRQAENLAALRAAILDTAS